MKVVEFNWNRLFFSFYQANDFVSVIWPYQNEIHHISEVWRLDIQVQAIFIPLTVKRQRHPWRAVYLICLRHLSQKEMNWCLEMVFLSIDY